MISYKFDYKVAGSLGEAFSMLEDAGDSGSFIAGGHSLVPAMKLRLAQPETLIDISKVPGMSDITGESGVVNIGGLVTHADVASSELVKNICPGLSECASAIGDAQVRNKGTIGGNVAHADPGSDYPGALVAFGATICLESPSGVREIPADEFFTGLFETNKSDIEIITAVKVPSFPLSTYVKFPNPASRYAVVGVGVALEMSGIKCKTISIGITGVADHAFRASSTELILKGSELSESDLDSAASMVTDGQEIMTDLVASSEYRSHLCGVMLKRAILNIKAKA